MAAERSGTFKLTGLYDEMSMRIPAPRGPLPTYEVSIITQEQVPCPSPWRHPLRWLRWNPLLTERRKITLYDVALEADDGDR